MSEPSISNMPGNPAHAAAMAAPAHGEIRLSFGYFYVVLRWGRERRSASRIDADRKAYPVWTATHAPVLIGIWAAQFLLLYYIAKLSLTGLIHLVS